MALRSAPLVLRQAGRLAAGLSLRDQALAVGTVLVGAGRYPPPPPLFPLLLRQPATAKLSTRTSRTAVTMYRSRRIAHLLVPVCLLWFGEPAAPQTIPCSSVREETPCAPAPRRSRLVMSRDAPAGQRYQPNDHRVAKPWRWWRRCAQPGRTESY